MTYSYKEIYEIFQQIGTKAGTAKKLKLPRTSVRRAIDEYSKYLQATARGVCGYENIPDKMLTNKGDNESFVEVNSLYKKILTKEQEAKELFDKALEEYLNEYENEEKDSFTGIAYEDESEEEIFNRYNLNSKQWQIVSISHNEWTTPFKNDAGKIIPFVNKQKKVLFKKIVSDITLDIIREQYEMLTNKVSHTQLVRTREIKPILYEIAIADHHFGKLAWAAETGENYDYKVAKQLYIDAVIDLLVKASHYKIDKILLPIGNDLFNFDNMDNKTTAGTPQDNDSRWSKLFRIVSETMIESIDLLRKVADVDILIVPGNHDRATCFYLGEFLSAWYRNDSHVNIDNSPMLRKYYRYGKTLLGFTHGSEEKQADLPLLMAREAKEDWGKAEWYEYQVGHWHKKKLTKFISGDTYNGVSVRVLPSLTGTDAWHYSKGYAKGVRAATGFIYDINTGFEAEFLSKI